MNVRLLQNPQTLVLVGMIGFISMGNESCEQAQSRVLKMDVSAATISAQKIAMPTGEMLDFPTATNVLFVQELGNSQYFNVSAPADSTADDANLVQAFTQVSVSSPVATSTDASVPTCVYDSPQAALGGNVLSFEATWGAGLGVGYTQAGSLSGGTGGNVTISQSQLEIGLNANDPLAQDSLAVADVASQQTNLNLAVQFIEGLPLGLNFIYNTPISDVIKGAIDSGLSNLVKKFEAEFSTTNSWNDVWESKVVYDPIVADDVTHVAIRGGYREGVQVGDTFTVKNMQYVWSGTACSSTLQYQIATDATPIAELTVISVGDNVSVAIVSQVLVDEKIQAGAQVKILKLASGVTASPTPTGSPSP